jgi:predicted RNA-binding protein with RPS1 domain
VNAIPRIISDNLWTAVQNRVEESRANRTKTSNQARATIEYLLSGKITCGICGENYNGTYGTGRNGLKHYYYSCHNKRRKKNKCNSKNHPMEWLDDFVIERTINDVLCEETIEIITNKVLEFQKKDSISFSLKSLEKQQKICNKKLKNLMNAIEEGIITPSTKERLAELEAEKDFLAVSIAKEKKKRVLFTKDQIVYWLELFREGVITDDSRERIANMFINHIVVEPNQIIIAYNLLSIEKAIPLETIKERVRPDVDIME